MEQFNCPFTVFPSSTDEHHDANESPANIVQILARRKATDVAAHHSNAVIIGADTVVVHNQTIFEKPRDPQHASEMLKKLSDDSHMVLTGIALLKTDRSNTIVNQQTFVETTTVTFGSINDAEIKRYVATGSPLDKAGAYGIQDDFGAFFVKRIEGDYYNIVGLPLHALYNHLKSFAPELLQY